MASNGNGRRGNAGGPQDQRARGLPGTPALPGKGGGVDCHQSQILVQTRGLRFYRRAIDFACRRNHVDNRLALPALLAEASNQTVSSFAQGNLHVFR